MPKKGHKANKCRSNRWKPGRRNGRKSGNTHHMETTEEEEEEYTDMSHAYQQLQLDYESKQYTTINTHKGLLQYTRLPHGISSAPGIFHILNRPVGGKCHVPI